ncbi:hypothetical protein R1flu_028538 [Riccia fluitans]|uniref:Uncharacterized protein n=1 Tax=Riccia fluitans TaxID=41844 RepID=A0ABD1XLZ5_9MARC
MRASARAHCKEPPSPLRGCAHFTSFLSSSSQGPVGGEAATFILIKEEIVNSEVVPVELLEWIGRQGHAAEDEKKEGEASRVETQRARNTPAKEDGSEFSLEVRISYCGGGLDLKRGGSSCRRIRALDRYSHRSREVPYVDLIQVKARDSHDKGCRPYMCDTSYRHSNCLDQFRKAKSVSDKLSDRVTEPTTEAGLPTSLSDGGAEDNRRHSFRPFGAAIRGLMRRDDGVNTAPLDRGVAGTVLRGPQPLGLARLTREQILNGSPAGSRGLQILNAPERVSGAEVLPDSVESAVVDVSEGRASGGGVGTDPNGELQDLLCPLCRGKVFGWKVVEGARHQLNRKPRSCAQESCSFSGTYKELREHARAIHPTARPSDIDPARQRDWRRLERQRDLGDVLSTIRSAMPGATVLGDYVIEDEDEDHEDDGDDSDFPGDDGNWWTVFLLFQVFGPAAPFAGGRGFPGRMSRLTRGPANPMMRQALWGETFQANGISGAITNHTGTSVNLNEGNLGSTSRRRRSRPRSRGASLIEVKWRG